MSRTEVLKSLESLLESFLERAVAMKEDRLRVLDGINRLDEIARRFQASPDLADEVGGWFAEHSNWLRSSSLRPADQTRISELLESIKRELETSPEVSAAQQKIAKEIDRWGIGDKKVIETTGQAVILRRASERAAARSEEDTIALYDNTLDRLLAMYKDMCANKAHLLTVLDDALRSARFQQSRDALLLSASIIYYLKLNRYKVEPYVKRLREAEALLAGETNA